MRARPSSPSPAVWTSYPSISSRACSDSRISTSSSTIRTEPGVGRASASVRRAMTAASDIHGLSCHGELQMKRGALSRVALDANFARVFLDDAVRHRESQAGPAVLAFARSGLGGEERV